MLPYPEDPDDWQDPDADLAEERAHLALAVPLPQHPQPGDAVSGLGAATRPSA